MMPAHSSYIFIAKNVYTQFFLASITFINLLKSSMEADFAVVAAF